MKDILVVYGSQYGSTKQYAEAIAKQLSTRCVDVKEVRDNDWKEAALIIYGGGVYAGKLYGSASIRRNESILRNKKLIVFSCGNVNSEDEKNKQALLENIKNSIGETLCKEASCFYLRGDLLYSKMKFRHRLMMKMMITALKKQKDLDEEAKVLIKTYGQDVHFINVETVQALVKCAKEKLEEAS